MKKIKPSELIHIWKTEPCLAGDTLSGGSNVKDLMSSDLIEPTPEGYVTTSKGKQTVQRFIEFLDFEFTYLG